MSTLLNHQKSYFPWYVSIDLYQKLHNTVGKWLKNFKIKVQTRPVERKMSFCQHLFYIGKKKKKLSILRKRVRTKLKANKIYVWWSEHMKTNRFFLIENHQILMYIENIPYQPKISNKNKWHNMIWHEQWWPTEN